MTRIALFFALLFAVTPLTAADAAELVMFEEDGCPWCERWNEEIGVVYDRTREGRLAPLRRVDMHAPLPEDLRGLKLASYSPTFVVVSNGREVGRILGYPGEDFFWDMLDKILEKLPQAASAQKQGN